MECSDHLLESTTPNNPSGQLISHFREDLATTHFWFYSRTLLQGRTKSGRGGGGPKLGRDAGAAQAADGVQGPRPGVGGGGGSGIPPEAEKN